MNKESYKSLLAKLADPTTVADTIVELNNLLDKDIKAVDDMKADYDSKLNALRDTNAKLALRLTDGNPDTHDDEDKFYTDIETAMKGV